MKSATAISLETLQFEFEWLNNALLENSLPVGYRPKAVLELWEIFDQLQALNQDTKTE